MCDMVKACMLPVMRWIPVDDGNFLNVYCQSILIVFSLNLPRMDGTEL